MKKRNYFNLIPLNYKLALLGFVPLLALIFFFYIVEKGKADRISGTNSFIARIDLTLATDKLVEQLQQERRLSVSKIFNQQDEGGLSVQQLKTDEAIQQLNAYIDKGLIADYGNYTFLNELPKWRTEINNGEISYEEVFNHYQKITERLSSLSQVSTDYSNINESLGSSIALREVLSKAVNYVASLRLNLFFTIADEKIDTLDLGNFNINYELLDSYLKELESLDKRYGENNLEKLLANRSFSTTINFFAEIHDSGKLPERFNADDWWNISGAAMDFLRAGLATTIQEIAENANHTYQEELHDRNFTRAALIIWSLIVLSLIYLVIKNIANHLFELQEAATKIAMGYTNIPMPIFAKDDLGVVARSIRRIDQSNQEIARVANEIGRENYEVQINPKGAHDILGNALLNMKQSLESHSQKDKQQLWIQSGENIINNLLIGRRELNAFGLDILKALVEHLQADIGTYYIGEFNQTLQFVCAVGVDNTLEIPQRINMGETLLGKAALNKEATLITNLPENYLKVSSSLGTSQPSWVLIIPLVHENEVEGVIEIASLKHGHESTLHLANSISKNLGAAIHAVKSRIRLKELLEETQAQTEELQAQQSELENLNVELEAQANRLQASEEELRVQQEELLEANQELEIKSQALEEKNQVILERNLEIQKKAEDLALSTKYKSEFLANMSHELRTPLNSILLLSRLLSENNEGNLLEDQIEYAKVIQTSGNGLLTLIDEILDLSKIEAGKMTLTNEELPLSEIVNDIQVLFGPMANEKGLQLKTEIAKNSPTTIITDNLRLQQILRNLVSNALKFTSKGSVSISVSQNTEKEEFIEFRVRDTGIGIPEEKQQLIFEAFQQADGSTRRKFGGTGLGLSISKELARLLGGSLAINSKVTKGSEFILNIPKTPIKEKQEQTSPSFLLQATPEKKETPSASKEKNSPAKPTVAQPFISKNIPNELDDDRREIQEGDSVVLIIEDDTNFARALIDFSRQNNYKVITTVRGDVGIELAEKYLPHAILLDIELPVKNGWQVMDELKSNPNTRHIPVHIMSSHEVKRESITRGAIDFIRKPMALEQLGQIFNRVEKALSVGSRKVLIIEDNLKHAQALAHYLESFDVKTDIRKDIQSGVSTLKSHEADCVILDMGIPDATAYKALETIKADAGMENLPVIIFTGKNLSPSEELKIKQYADSIVVKTAHSYERILDEVALFLHIVEENNDKSEQKKEKSKLNSSLNEVLNGKTVLIADDDIRNIFSLTKALERYKINVIPADDGREALNILQHTPSKIDIVLMDMMMPEMDGYETTTRIRQDKRFKNLPILAVTAKAMIGDREKCIAAGASDYISKPVDIDQLISLLRVWLYQ
ncbi:response regulator [Olivibacter sp. SDN3]|uniref:response regulator n=1 Tax=Olivibacter sp. SDN3 TaxID=2764720 RepID=UPI001651A218|nr:response regulator [Olivibacter sp. SDN3]QNL50849.1 response regulator [Olivibacter sp. SDN3]